MRGRSYGRNVRKGKDRRQGSRSYWKPGYDLQRHGCKEQLDDHGRRKRDADACHHKSAECRGVQTGKGREGEEGACIPERQVVEDMRGRRRGSGTERRGEGHSRRQHGDASGVP